MSLGRDTIATSSGVTNHEVKNMEKEVAIRTGIITRERQVVAFMPGPSKRQIPILTRLCGVNRVSPCSNFRA
jgi:hypothetical protein